VAALERAAERGTGPKGGVAAYRLDDLAAVLEGMGRRSDPAMPEAARRELATGPELRAAWLASDRSLPCEVRDDMEIVWLEDDGWRL
jgi:hypothetical protein